MSFKPRDQVSPHERARGRRSSTEKKKETTTSPPQRYGERASGNSGVRASRKSGELLRAGMVTAVLVMVMNPPRASF